MRLPVKSLVAELRRSSDTARETRAAELYSADKLRAAMVAAAGLGFQHATIRGLDGLDLRDTKAAEEALAWLSAEKVAAEFKFRDGAGGIEAASTYDLVLSWKPPVEA